MTDDRLGENHVIVTGAAKGIGRGIAVRASQSGADVTVFDVDADGAAETAVLVREQGSRAETCDVDVTDPDTIESGLEAATDALGPVDGFVNNAGIQDVLPILETSPAQWDRYMAVNAKGTFLCSKAVAQHMIEEAVQGSIVNIASVAAVDPAPGQGGLRRVERRRRRVHRRSRQGTRRTWDQRQLDQPRRCRHPDVSEVGRPAR